MFAARVLSRTLGPPCSNVVTFSVEGHPGVTFCAYAVSDGAIIVQQSLEPAASQAAPGAAGSGYSAASAAAPPASAPRVAPCGSFAPVLLIDSVALEHGSDCFSRVCWGGGPEALLAAATKQHVYFFSLLAFFQGGSQPLQLQATPLLPPPSTAYTLCAMYRTTMPATAIDFTQNARGLLLTDAGNNVTMLRLVPKETLVQYGISASASAGTGTSASLTSATALAAAASQRQLGVATGTSRQVQQQQQQVAATVALAVHEAWRVRADSPHTLAAASLDCYTPCATTTAAAGGGGGPHKVTIWWPAQPETGPPGGAAGGAAAATHHGTPAVGAEIVRHPVRVLSMQWSPPLAGSRPPGGGGGSGADGASVTPGPADGASRFPSRGHGDAAAAAAGVAAAGSTGPQLAASPPAPSTAPALMTLGVDWVIRIYVEVVMQNMLPPERAASAAGLSMSQFCLTLVIEPPGLSLAPSSRPGMRACWARPLGLGGAGAAGGGPQAEAGGREGREDGAGEQGAGSGGGGAAMTLAAAGSDSGGSRLQWIVASVGLVATDDTGSYDANPSAAPIEEAVCVWAVDGLSAVVLSGMPRGSVSSAKTTASPKAVLWGMEQRSVSWLQPTKLVPPMPGGLRPGDYAISAYVTYPGGMPLLRTADSCVGMQGAYAEVRGYQISPAATTTPGSAGQTATFLRVGALARQAMMGSPEAISSMLVHPAADVALLRDRTGGVALWSLSPLCELPIGVVPAAASASRVLLASPGQLAAVTWLSYCSRLQVEELAPPSALAGPGGGAPGPAAGAMLAYMACVHSGRLLVYSVLLPAATVAGWNEAAVAAAAAAVQAGGLGWGAMFLSEVLRVDLPPGVSSVRSLHEVSYDDGDGAVSDDGQPKPAVSALVALATRRAPSSTCPGPTSADGSGPSTSAAAAAAARSASAGGAPMYGTPQPQEEQQEVWVTWRLALHHQLPSGPLAVQLVSEYVDEIGAAIGVATRGSLDLLAPPAPARASVVACCCTSLTSSSGVDSDASSCGTYASSFTERRGSDGGTSSTSGSTSSRRVPTFMSGSSDGYVHFWRPASPDWAAGGRRGLELVQWLLCKSDARRPSTTGGMAIVRRTSSGLAESPRSGGAGGTGPAAAAGMVVAVALDETSGYAAAATTGGDGEEEEALFIWRLREDVEDGAGVVTVPWASDGSAGTAAAAAAAAAATSARRRTSGGGGAAAAAYGTYQLESVVPVNDTVSALAWLAAAGYSACLAVGYASGRVGLLVRDRSGVWEEVASYSGAAAVSAFGSARSGAVAMAAGNHLVCFSNTLDCKDPDQRPNPTIATMAADLAGPLPPYHPGTVHALVAKGKLSAACRVLRRLLEWLREGSQHAGAVAGAEGSGEGIGDDDGRGKAAVDGDRRGVRPTAVRPPLVVDVAELLSDSLVGSRGLAAFQQVLAAPVLAPPPGPPAMVPAATATATGRAAPPAAAPAPYPARTARPPLSDDGPLRPIPGLEPQRPPGLGGSGAAAGLGGASMPAGRAGSGGEPRVVGAAAKSPTLESGMLDMSAFGGFGGDSGLPSTAPPPPQQQQAPPAPASSTLSQETGMMGMSAFGDWGGFGHQAAAPAPVENPPRRSEPVRSALETGALDMSAFGGFGEPFQEPAPAPGQVPAAASPQSTLETGMLDMSAFGGFGAPAHRAQPQPVPARSALETGTLDMSAFGDFGGGGPAAAVAAEMPTQAPRPSALETGTVDLSAFGDFGSGALGLPQVPPSQRPPHLEPQPERTSSQRQSLPPPPLDHGTSAVHTGMLDMSAFGDFGGGFGHTPPPPPPPPPPPAPPPPPPVTQPSGHDPMSSGMLDMGFFNGFGDFLHAAAPPSPPSRPPAVAEPNPEPPPPRPPADHGGDATLSASGAIPQAVPASARPLSISTAFAHPPLHENLRSALPPPDGGAEGPGASAASPAAAARSGLSSVPTGGAAWGHVASTWPAAVATVPPVAPVPSNRTGSSSLLFTPLSTLPQPLSPKSSVGDFPGGPAAPRLRLPSAASSGAAAAGLAEPAGAAAGSRPDAEEVWVTFPRVPEPATPADSSLPDLLLTPSEVSEMHRLLGQNPPSPAPDGIGQVAAQAQLQRMPPPSRRYGDGADGGAASSEADAGADADRVAIEDAVAALTSLGLTPDDAAELCQLAGALTRRSVGASGGGADSGSGGGSGTTDVTVGLDFAARAFLAHARLAAEWTRAVAEEAGGGQDDSAFAAAVSRLFRPVSVTRAGAGQPNDPSPSTVASGGTAQALARQGLLPRSGERAASTLGRDGLAAARAPGSFAAASPPSSISYSHLANAAGPSRGGRHGALSGSPLVHRSRSVRSVISVLSFSSLPDSFTAGRVSRLGGPEGGEGDAAGATGNASSSWWRVCGLMPGLDMRSCLAALASGTQAQLLDAVLPGVPWDAAADDEASAAPEGRSMGMMGGGAGASRGGPGGPSTPPRPALSWPLLRKVGAGFWLADPRVVREQAEALAKAQYARRKEPYDCALLYLALGRKALLLSLFRQASNMKIADFLLRDFNQEEPRKSAAKNAFALLGQHRYELAAAFFILAAQPYEAVSVLVRERRDPQLALLVARLLDPQPTAGVATAAGATLGGPLARRLIEQELMPLALASGDSCAVATLECLAGNPTRAVLQLIAAGGDNRVAPAAAAAAAAAAVGAASSAAMPGGAAAATPRPMAVDAASLDYCLRIGVQYLSGKTVPYSVTRSLRRLALETSRALEHAGLATAALEALLVAAALLRQPPHAGGAAAAPGLSAPAMPPAMRRRYSRLLAACLCYSLTEAQVRQQQGVAAAAEGTPRLPHPPPPYGRDDVVAGASSGGRDQWQRDARRAMAALAPVLGPAADEGAVLRLLGRHISALQKVRQQLLVPPELLISRKLRPATAAAMAAAARVAGPAGGPRHSRGSAHPHRTSAAHAASPPPSADGLGQATMAASFGDVQVPSRNPSGGGAAAVTTAVARSAHLERLSPASSTGSLYGPAASTSSPPAAQPASPDGSTRGPVGQHCSFSGSARPPLGAPSAAAAAGGAHGLQQHPLQHYPSQGHLLGPGPSHPHGPLAQPATAVAAAAAAAAVAAGQSPASRNHTPPASPLSYSSSSSVAAGGAVDGARKGPEGSSASVPPSGWGVFEAPWDVLAVEGDRCRSVAALQGRGPDDNGQLPFAVATAKSGLLGSVLGPPALAPPSKAAGPSSLFLGLMQSVLHHVRWTPDPWAMMSGDFADESFISMSGASVVAAGAAGGGGGGGAAGGGGGGAPGAGGGGGGGGGLRSASPAPHGHSGGGGGHGAAGSTSTTVLASHPERDLYLSGSNGQLVYQWRFGEALAQTAYVPCLEPHGAAAATAAAAAARSRTASGGGSAAAPAVSPAAAAAAMASSLDLHASHWGHAAALTYSTPSGGRFAGIGDGGLVAMWRTDVLGPGNLGYADWTHHCVGKHGRAICFVGDSSSQLLVAGQGDRGGLVGWWDSLAPPSAACVAEIRGRKAVPSVLALLRPDAGGVLVFGDESGELVATDLRMMSAREFIWTIPKTHGSSVTSISQWGPSAAGVINLPAALSPHPSQPGHGGHVGRSHAHAHGGPGAHHPQQQQQALSQARISNLLVSGGKDGSMALVDISSGKVVSFLDRAHCSTRTGLPGLLAAAAAAGGNRAVDRTIVRRARPAAAAGVAVSGLFCLPDAGVISCGADGVVRYHPLAPQLLDLRR